MQQLEAALAVIIGGGNGIGEATCRLMVQRGWRVAVADYDAEAAKRVGDELDAPNYQLDIRDGPGVKKLAEDIERDIGPVYSLVVAAAMVQERSEPEDYPLETYRNLMITNVEATFNANRCFAAGMIKRRKGSIVNIASTGGHWSTPLYAYGPSKAAVINLTQTLASYWGKSGVRVNSVSPGATMTKRVLARKPGRYAGNIDDYMALGRRIEPMEIAEPIEFLASDRASAITGTDLLVDAGMLAAGGWALYGGTPGPKGG